VYLDAWLEWAVFRYVELERKAKTLEYRHRLRRHSQVQSIDGKPSLAEQ
jgi:hypothetical protein